MSGSYLMHALMSPVIKNQYAKKVTGSTVAHVNMADIRRFAFPVPPAEEQTRIIAEVERRLSVLDATELTVKRDLARSSRLRQSILKWAFEGKLADQNPDDEPAEVLLERIKAERETTKPKKTRRGRPRSRA